MNLDGIDSDYTPDTRLLPPSIRDERSLMLLHLFWGLLQFQTDRLNVYNIDTVDESVLQHLMQQFRLEKFFPPNLSVDRRRQIIKRAIEIWRYIGTIYGIRVVCDAVLGITVNISEWYEFNGTPHTFSVAFPIDQVNAYSGDFGTNFQNALRQLIEASKPARSHLLSLDLALNENLDLNMAVTTGDDVIVFDLECYRSGDSDVTVGVQAIAGDLILVKV